MPCLPEEQLTPGPQACDLGKSRSSLVVTAEHDVLRTDISVSAPKSISR